MFDIFCHSWQKFLVCGKQFIALFAAKTKCACVIFPKTTWRIVNKMVCQTTTKILSCYFFCWYGDVENVWGRLIASYRRNDGFWEEKESMIILWTNSGQISTNLSSKIASLTSSLVGLSSIVCSLSAMFSLGEYNACALLCCEKLRWAVWRTLGIQFCHEWQKKSMFDICCSRHEW
jgi:uncharacterized membrane protein YeiB